MACVCLKEWLDIFNTAALARKTNKRKEILSVHLSSYIMAAEAQLVPFFLKFCLEKKYLNHLNFLNDIALFMPLKDIEVPLQSKLH